MRIIFILNDSNVADCEDDDVEVENEGILEIFPSKTDGVASPTPPPVPMTKLLIVLFFNWFKLVVFLF